MKKLSETLTELGIAFSFPIEINDAKGNETYYENSDGYWERSERDAKGNETYFENSSDYWYRYERDANGYVTYCENSSDFWERWEHDANGNVTYYENSDGFKEGTPKSSKTCEGKVVEVDGIKYELKADLTMNTSKETQRFQAYYIDYLLNYDSIGSYAASHKLTYETAQHRIKTGERVHLALTESATCDALAATGLAFF